MNSGTFGTAAQSEDECVCDEEFYDAIVGAGVNCKLCPVGTGCPQGSKLEALPISTGYYRLDNASVDVREHPTVWSLFFLCTLVMHLPILAGSPLPGRRRRLLDELRDAKLYEQLWLHRWH